MPKKFSAAHLEIIQAADLICREYTAQGFTLTLRQVFYQFVSRGWMANHQTEYKRLGGILNDARLAGLLDWDHMEDRTRNLRRLGHWSDPADILQASANSYRIDKWEDQPNYCEVWIEKDALVGVIGGVCDRLDVPYFSCRGYTSQSELWSAAMRLVIHIKAGQWVTILHLGDHDPSGIDMTRDIEDRLRLFLGGHLNAGQTAEALDIDRLALNWNQVEEYEPPPNPAKLTDSRSSGYVERFGLSSWELDALEPTVIGELVEVAVAGLREDDLWDDAVEREQRGRDELQRMADTYTGA